MMELIQERRSEYMAESSLYLDGEEAPPYPARAPPPQPPLISKFHIYTDPMEFADVDKIAISVSNINILKISTEFSLKEHLNNGLHSIGVATYLNIQFCLNLT